MVKDEVFQTDSQSLSENNNQARTIKSSLDEYPDSKASVFQERAGRNIVGLVMNCSRIRNDKPWKKKKE